jgi:hypothetical protein
MKYARIKRLVYAILKEHKGQRELADLILLDHFQCYSIRDGIDWYLCDNFDKIFLELYNEGKIKKPTYFGEWITDLI